MTDRQTWESRCRRCGRCCFEKIDYEGEIYYTATPCPYLDLESRLCQIYPDRHRLKPDCAPLESKVLIGGMLPADCPYVAGIPDYRPPRLWPDDDD